MKKIVIKPLSQLEAMSSKRGTPLPAPRVFRSKKDYNRSNWKRQLD